MKLAGSIVLSLLFSFAAFAQHGEPHGGVGGGHIPAHGPEPSHAAPASRNAPETRNAPARNAPEARNAPAARNAPERNVRDQPGHPAAPHVHGDDTWVGHAASNDAHYHLDRPWAHGHFGGPIGRDHVYRLGGGGPQRFGFGGFFFSVAPYDVGYCSGWLWNSDDIVHL